MVGDGAEGAVLGAVVFVSEEGAAFWIEPTSRCTGNVDEGVVVGISSALESGLDAGATTAITVM